MTQIATDNLKKAKNVYLLSLKIRGRQIELTIYINYENKDRCIMINFIWIRADFSPKKFNVNVEILTKIVFKNQIFCHNIIQHWYKPMQPAGVARNWSLCEESELKQSRRCSRESRNSLWIFEEFMK